uniref:Uncharacterized protein n=1 Tax=Opuntia streptacantha TaxID=393608 RepID=A0A7C9A906_OPUST
MLVSHRSEILPPFLDKSSLAASVKNTQECDIIRFNALCHHFIKDSKSFSCLAILSKPHHHSCPSNNCVVLYSSKNLHAVIHASTFYIHVEQSIVSTDIYFISKLNSQAMSFLSFIQESHVSTSFKDGCKTKLIWPYSSHPHISEKFKCFAWHPTTHTASCHCCPRYNILGADLVESFKSINQVSKLHIHIDY